MPTTTAPTVKDHELTSLGLLESASVNSFADFTPSKFNESQVTSQIGKDKEKEDFINTFICHLLFYAVFCISIVLHILIDLGLGSFIKNKLVQFFGLAKITIFEKRPAFA